MEVNKHFQLKTAKTCTFSTDFSLSKEGKKQVKISTEKQLTLDVMSTPSC